MWGDKSSYEGDWKFDKMDGFGKYVTADGAVAEGWFESD